MTPLERLEIAEYDDWLAPSTQMEGVMSAVVFWGLAVMTLGMAVMIASWWAKGDDE